MHGCIPLLVGFLYYQLKFKFFKFAKSLSYSFLCVFQLLKWCCLFVFEHLGFKSLCSNTSEILGKKKCNYVSNLSQQFRSIFFPFEWIKITWDGLKWPDFQLSFLPTPLLEPALQIDVFVCIHMCIWKRGQSCVQTDFQSYNFLPLVSRSFLQL